MDVTVDACHKNYQVIQHFCGETVVKRYGSEEMSQIKVIAENYRKVASVVMEWFQKE